MKIWRKRLSEWLNEWINHKAVCRTAPATPGLLKSVHFFLLLSFFFKNLRFKKYLNPKQKFFRLFWDKQIHCIKTPQNISEYICRFWTVYEIRRFVHLCYWVVKLNSWCKLFFHTCFTITGEYWSALLSLNWWIYPRNQEPFYLHQYCNEHFCIGFIYRHHCTNSPELQKLDGVGPVDNRPSTD